MAARATFAQDLAAAQRSKGHLTAADYMLAPEVTYLNHASIGTVPRLVHEAHVRYLSACESNPWLHVWGGEWTAAMDRTHRLAAEVMGTADTRVAVVRNATAAFGMAANGLPLGAGHEVLFSSLNHTGASASWTSAAPARGFTVRRFPFPEAEVATMTSDDVTRVHVDAIRDETEALVLPHIDNIYGIRHDVAAIAKAARDRGVRWVLVDGAQSVGMHRVQAEELGVDLYATSAHKWLQAPKGTGLMALSPAAIDAMRPQVTSWGQSSWEGSARAFTDFGTRDLAKVLTVGDAIELHQRRSEGREDHYRRLRTALAERVATSRQVEWRSPAAYDPGGASIAALGLSSAGAKAVAQALFREDGIVVRGFESGAQNHLRLSPGCAETTADLERFWQALAAKLA